MFTKSPTSTLTIEVRDTFRIMSNSKEDGLRVVAGMIFEEELVSKIKEYRSIYSDRPDIYFFAVADIEIYEDGKKIA